MLIREEEEKDFNNIREAVKSAFLSAEHTDGNEYNLVSQLRKSDGFVKKLALVAEEDGKIIGHIMFTEAKIGESLGVALAPLSVVPTSQNKGIGTKLMNKAHEIARKMGYEFSVVLGSEKYYPKVGYKIAKDYGVFPPFDVPSENYMILYFTDNCSKINGTVEYAKEIFE